MADIYDIILFFSSSGSHNKLKLIAQFEILRRLNKLNPFFLLNIKILFFTILKILFFKSVLNLQMTYIIIAHIYEQWDR